MTEIALKALDFEFHRSRFMIPGYALSSLSHPHTVLLNDTQVVPTESTILRPGASFKPPLEIRWKRECESSPSPARAWRARPLMATLSSRPSGGLDARFGPSWAGRSEHRGHPDRAIVVTDIGIVTTGMGPRDHPAGRASSSRRMAGA